MRAKEQHYSFENRIQSNEYRRLIFRYWYFMCYWFNRRQLKGRKADKPLATDLAVYEESSFYSAAS